jgi:hypothetical protein
VLAFLVASRVQTGFEQLGEGRHVGHGDDDGTLWKRGEGEGEGVEGKCLVDGGDGRWLFGRAATTQF